MSGGPLTMISSGRPSTSRRVTGLLLVGLLSTMCWVLTAALAWLAWTQTRLLLADSASDFAVSLDIVLALCAAAVSGWLACAVTSSSARILRGLPRARFTPATLHRLIGVVIGVTTILTPLSAQAAPLPAASSLAQLDPGWGTVRAPSATPTSPPPAVSPSPTVSSSATVSPTSPQTAEPTASASTSSAPTTLPGPKSSAPQSAWVPPAAPPKVATPADPAVIGTPRAAPPDELTVVVQRGDTLWGIAARHLEPDATAVDIAAAWPQWYAANQAVIGADPDLIRPGQVLRVPG